jgi:hypothetical protein
VSGEGEAGRPGWVRRLSRTYFSTAAAPPLEGVRAALWTQRPEPAPAQDAGYRAALIEQYKLYVEMADRISARRGLTNTFFLSLNTGIVTVIGVLAQHPPKGPAALLVVPWVVLVVQCMSWFWLLRSYRQLNTAKYVVVGMLEERLPASPYWRAEWAALGEGRDPARYWPLSHVEQWIPVLFALAYTAGLIALLLA